MVGRDARSGPRQLVGLAVLLLITLLVVTGLPRTRAAASVKAQYRAADTSAGDNAIKPHLNLVNTGTTSVALSTLKVRYYYTKEGTAGEQYWCDWAQRGCANITGTFAAGYLEVGFTSGAGSLAPGESTGEIQSRFNKTDWSTYNESDDYSYDPAKTSFADHARVTIYESGALVWGTPPDGTTPPTATSGVSASATRTRTATTGTGATATRTRTRTRTATGGTGATATRTRTRTATTGGTLPTATRTRTATSGTVVTATPIVSSSTLYVAPSGSDSAPGTLSQPTSLGSAITRVQAGGVIYMRGGLYSFSAGVTIARGNNGTAGAPKQLFAYPGETPVLNFAAQATSSSNRGLTINGFYWHVKGLVVERAGDNGIFIGGNNNIVERCVTRFNRDTGLQLGRHSSTAPFAEWPANNLILSCESHDNMDPTGENADGFAAKLTTGNGNVFRYCVAHNNIDDGWDLYTKTDTGAIGPVTIEDSIAYRNGTLTDGTTHGNGDRNGFKLGGEDIAVNHIVRRNLAYNNGKHGYTYNRNLGSIAMTGNVGVNSAERNFNFDGGSSVFRGNISCRGGSGTNDRIVGNDDGSNAWWMGSNSSQCAAYSGTFSWSFNADGSLSYRFQ